jgi:hypothetical protein
LPVGPEERTAAEFGGGGVRRADPDAAGVEPFRQLIGEFRGAEAVVATKEDDGSAASRHQPTLGGEEAEVERGAGAF